MSELIYDHASRGWEHAIELVERLSQEKEESALARLRRKAEPFAWLVEFLDGDDGKRAKKLLLAAINLNNIKDYAFPDLIPTCVKMWGSNRGSDEVIGFYADGIAYHERRYDVGPQWPGEFRPQQPQFTVWRLSAHNAAALLAEKKSGFTKDDLLNNLDKIANEIAKRLAAK